MSSGSSRPYEQAPGRGGGGVLLALYPLSSGVVMLTCAHALFALFQLGEELKVPRHLRDRHDCGYGGSGYFRSVMARFCRGKTGAALSSMGKKIKLSMFAVAQVLGAGVGGREGLTACSAGHEAAVRSNAKPRTQWWGHGSFQVNREQQSRGAGLSHPSSLPLTGQRRPSSKLQQFRPATCKGPDLSFHAPGYITKDHQSHLNKLTLSCNGDIKTKFWRCHHDGPAAGFRALQSHPGEQTKAQ